jgi:hypothetical protein
VFTIINDQLISIKHNRAVQLQIVNENDRFRAATVFGIRPTVAAAMAKGLIYTPVKGA